MNESICAVLFKFANSFDLKDWQGLENTLMDKVECDYQELRGTIENYTKNEYVNLRKEALHHLKTQHIFSNLEIITERTHATCRLNAIIFRQNHTGINFNSHVMYVFYLVNCKNNEWKIKKIKQSLLWNEGDASIHKGINQ